MGLHLGIGNGLFASKQEVVMPLILFDDRDVWNE
jgi:hypothetical protein